MSRWLWDIVYWLVFISGQMMFLLKRADLARRSPLNGVISIGSYFVTNWVVIVQRLAFESLFLFLYRHPDFPSQLGLHFTLPLAKQSLVLAFFGGFFADAILDWIAMQNTLLGITIPSWIKESIPQLPQVQNFVAGLVKNGG